MHDNTWAAALYSAPSTPYSRCPADVTPRLTSRPPQPTGGSIRSRPPTWVGSGAHLVGQGHCEEEIPGWVPGRDHAEVEVLGRFPPTEWRSRGSERPTRLELPAPTERSLAWPGSAVLRRVRKPPSIQVQRGRAICHPRSHPVLSSQSSSRLPPPVQFASPPGPYSDPFAGLDAAAATEG